MTSEQIAALWAEYLEAATPSGATENGAIDLYDIEGMNDAAYALHQCCVAQAAELAETKRHVPRFPDHMETVVSAKNAGLPKRIVDLAASIEAIPEDMRQYQWVADQRQLFGDKWVRQICGDNGRGMGRQAIAAVVAHIGVADYIAAANPDTVSMLIAALAGERAKVEALSLMPPWEDRPDDLTEAVMASHPVHSRDYGSYVRALELVSNRHSKGALVALVCHLLREADLVATLEQDAYASGFSEGQIAAAELGLLEIVAAPATPPAAVIEAMERAMRAADDYLDRGLDKMARNITRAALADLEAWRAGK